jgi:hypothetical protein
MTIPFRGLAPLSRSFGHPPIQIACRNRQGGRVEAKRSFDSPLEIMSVAPRRLALRRRNARALVERACPRSTTSY